MASGTMNEFQYNCASFQPKMEFRSALDLDGIDRSRIHICVYIYTLFSRRKPTGSLHSHFPTWKIACFNCCLAGCVQTAHFRVSPLRASELVFLLVQKGD
eukprot:TRINITY_DN14561_c0_g1_i1.p1 TRINITY_DN14561_c0_g1~~TRINITY_DN14561_c0_g1_i1.p1  ORF type:complete len:100 (-),score=3.15 TRINITY_DN14561_c0_g1_i1:40-339(-)